MLIDILKNADAVILTTVSKDQNLASRPMQAQEAEFDGDLWFITRKDTAKYDEINENPNVNVAVFGGSNASISGKATFVDDLSKKKEYWSKAYEAIFDTGYDEPMLVLIKVTADTAEYWETGNVTKSVVNFFKQVVGKKEPAEPGDDVNESVILK